MDRLSLVAALALLGACEAPDSGTAPAPMRSRVDAVPAGATPKAPTPSEFCDVAPGGAEAKSFSYPELAEPAPAVAGAWQWVNVWATWCVPCIAEMPMIEKWRARLTQSGKPVQLVYLSVDEDVTALETFRKDKQMAPGPRAKSLDALTPWLTTLGLDATAAIPINVFVDPQGKVRCVRTGALLEHHYDAVAQVVATP